MRCMAINIDGGFEDAEIDLPINYLDISKNILHVG